MERQDWNGAEDISKFFWQAFQLNKSGINCNSSKGQKSIWNHSDHLQLNNCCCRTISHQTLSNPTQPDPTLSNPNPPKGCQFPNKPKFWLKSTKNSSSQNQPFAPLRFCGKQSAALVGVESHRLHCPASKQALLCCQQPRVLQLPLLITTTGRVNRPEQATTLISSLINKTLPPTAAGLLHLKRLPFYKNCLQPSISAAQPLSTLSVSSSIPTLCTLAMANWTKPIPIQA